MRPAWSSVRANQQHGYLVAKAPRVQSRLGRLSPSLIVLRAACGIGGVRYLRKMLDVVLFPEIWKLRTDL